VVPGVEVGIYEGEMEQFDVGARLGVAVAGLESSVATD